MSKVKAVSAADMLLKRIKQDAHFAEMVIEERNILLEELEEKHSLADKLIKMVEWSASIADTDGSGYPGCPVCHEFKSRGHSPDCELHLYLTI
jgi:hypothetical protein